MGDGGPAINAQLNDPVGITLDPAGNLYIADAANQRIRKVRPDGIIETIAGTGERGNSCGAGPATSAKLNGPAGLALDGNGNLYIADT